MILTYYELWRQRLQDHSSTELIALAGVSFIGLGTQHCVRASRARVFGVELFEFSVVAF